MTYKEEERMMYITCLDVEGVLVPEIWIAFAKASNIPELKKTTRDEPDYDKLMKWRLGILKEHGLGLKEIQFMPTETQAAGSTWIPVFFPSSSTYLTVSSLSTGGFVLAMVTTVVKPPFFAAAAPVPISSL